MVIYTAWDRVDESMLQRMKATLKVVIEEISKWM